MKRKNPRLWCLAALLCLSACGGKTAAPAATPSVTPVPAAGGQAAVQPAVDYSGWKVTREVRYNADGAVQSWTDRTYDGGGRPLAEATYDSTGKLYTDDYTYYYEYAYSKTGLMTRTAFRQDGGIVYRYEYDANGNAVVWAIYEDGAEVMRYEDSFDTAGNLLSHTRVRAGEEPELMNTREYEYDGQGACVLCTVRDADGDVRSVYEYVREYDEQGRPTLYLERDRGQSIILSQYEYSYDEAGRLSEKRQYDDTGGRPSIYYRYEYDENGNLTLESVYDSREKLALRIGYSWARYGA